MLKFSANLTIPFQGTCHDLWYMNTIIKNGVTKSFGSIWKILKQKKRRSKNLEASPIQPAAWGCLCADSCPVSPKIPEGLDLPIAAMLFTQEKPQPRVTSFRNREKKKASNSSCLFKWWATLKRLIGTPPFCWIQLCKLVGELKGKCEEGEEGRKGRFGNWRIAVVCGFCVWKIVLLQ